MKNKYVNVIAVLGALSILLITSGVSLSLFNYFMSGTKENTITTGSITFLYDEQTKKGRGISITNAIPISNEVGRSQTDNVFDFAISSTTLDDMIIPYTVTAKLSSDSDSVLQDVVDLYLTDQTSTTEYLEMSKYSELREYEDNPNERIIYSSEVPEESNGANSYNQDFRLRMWIDENTDFSTGIYNNKTFKITVNVYAQGAEVTQAVLNSRSDASLRNIKLGQGTAIETEEEGTYEVVLPSGVSTTRLAVEPTNDQATVTITNRKSDSRVKNRSNVSLEEGTNTFDIVIMSKSGLISEQYTLNVLVGSCTGGYYGLKCSCDSNQWIAWQDGPYYDTNHNAMDATRVTDRLYPAQDTYSCGCSNGKSGYVVNTGQLLESTCPSSTPEPEPEPEPDENRIVNIKVEDRPFDDYNWRIRIPGSDTNGNSYFTNDEVTLDIYTQYNNADVIVDEIDDDENTINTYQEISNTRIESSNGSVSYKHSFKVKLNREANDTEYTYFKIQLLSKADNSVVYYYEYATIALDCDQGKYSSYNSDNTPWATWFLNEGRETYCSDAPCD